MLPAARKVPLWSKLTQLKEASPVRVWVGVRVGVRVMIWVRVRVRVKVRV